MSGGWLRPLGYLGFVLAGAFLLSGVVAGAYGEYRELPFFLIPGLCAIVAGVVTVFRSPAADLSSRDAMAFAALVYLLFSLVGALPFLGVSGFLRGWFEALSGITTTGLSLYTPEELPRSLLFFRSLLQWIGGAGILLLSLALFLPPGRTALSLYAAEYGQENIFGNVRLVARRVGEVYLGLTALGFLGFWGAGMSPFGAACHILSTLSTGGFSIYSDSIGHYSSGVTQGIVALFMLFGATSFPLFWLLVRGKAKALLSEPQVFLLLGGALVMGFLLWPAMGGPRGIFQAVSALSTTGFATTPTQSLSPAAKGLVILGMVMGGAGGSTAGGLKLFRVMALWALIIWSFRRVVLPKEAEIPFRLGRHIFPAEEVLEYGAYALLYSVALLGGSLVIAAHGYRFGDSLFEAASALGTVGLSVGITSATAPIGVKLVLMALMWMGRLEIIPVLLFLRRLGGRA